MTQPYTYVITWYPSAIESSEKPRIMHTGVILADSQTSAFSQMLNIVKPGNEYDPEEIEFIAKPFLDDKSCKTKADIASDIYYDYLKNSWSNINSTVGWTDYGFQRPFDKTPSVPKAMMMIDVIALLDNDKKL